MIIFRNPDFCNITIHGDDGEYICGIHVWPPSFPGNIDELGYHMSRVCENLNTNTQDLDFIPDYDKGVIRIPALRGNTPMNINTWWAEGTPAPLRISAERLDYYVNRIITERQK